MFSRDGEYQTIYTELPKELYLTVSKLAEELAVTEHSLVSVALRRLVGELVVERQGYLDGGENERAYRELIEARRRFRANTSI